MIDSQYEKTNWEDGDVVTSSKLNHIENGLGNLYLDVSDISSKVVELDGEIEDLIDKPISITLNGESIQSPSFYAPTSTGTSGQYLKSNGSGAPSWTSFPTIPSITLNGSSSTSPSFYAPTSAGTSGYYLKSNGSGAPTWAEVPKQSVASVRICQHSNTSFDYMFGYIVDNYVWIRNSVVTGGYHLCYYSEPIPKEQNTSLVLALTSSMIQHFDITVSGDIAQTPITKFKKTGESSSNSTIYYCYIITGDCSIDMSLK